MRVEIETRGHIGDVLGPNPGKSGPRSSDDDLTKDERYEFRLLSALWWVS